MLTCPVRLFSYGLLHLAVVVKLCLMCSFSAKPTTYLHNGITIPNNTYMGTRNRTKQQNIKTQIVYPMRGTLQVLHGCRQLVA